jgi:predicted dehydrogenase
VRHELRTGVIGVGSLGFHHARLLRETDGSNLIAVHDADATRAAEVGSRLETSVAGSRAELLDSVDACVIAVPTDAHEEVALAALERGVHVLIEKPIAPTLEAADRILAAAQRSGATVQIGHVERFNGALRACEEFLEEPLFVESHRLARFGSRGTDVAVVLDLMIHDVDLVLSMMKRPVAQIAAVGVAVLTPSPDIANARLEFEGGGVANLTASRVSLERLRKIRFFQRSGYISLDLATGTGEYLRLRPGIDLTSIGPVTAPGIDEIVERVPLRGDGAEPLRRELDSFLAAARGESEVVVTGEEGRAALAVALEIVHRIDSQYAVVDRNPA